ncbi:MAG: tRNA (N6-isopentenyl adenosine(37)-C2)-methylthiotransferase MiaB [Candidatus Ventricola sp.]|nr:tRNA (N6-isopentenyl adenosine(37)-C2)-methylthiotransferase MiaB [Candidatus Ventricola sp.]MDY3830890.1 tRNA (N6-isopentenyl adenosine(37)-C2)-methylthiotransferase MiaB [Candidatus Ventricola sp.]
MREFAAIENRPHTYCVVTYGCQMNAHDSEKLAGMLQEMGMTEAESRETADFVIFNTCCVRDNAQRRALGNVTWLKELKKTRPEMMVAVCGCMMQQKGMGEQILRQYPFVDVAFGTHNLYRFAQLMLQAVKNRRRVVEVIQEDEGSIPENLPVRRSSPHHAYITIMYGCNNFCSYCIVPYVRGRERSRASARIIEEARQLKEEGVKEIMLLGQNVNSYGLDVEGELSFAQLLAKLDEVGIERIRFMTSHPKDISDELIDVIAKSKHICHALHLPVQHGSSRVLASMNRKYTREQYLARVAEIRAKIPDMSLTTDLIVGYPGETEEEFEETCSLVGEVGYDSAFTFIYSPRIGTRAADMPDQIPEEVSSRRIQKLIAIQKENTRRNYAGYIGQVHSVLVEEASKRDEHQMAGKDEYNITVNFPGSKDLIGRIVRVRITSAGESTLRGEMID